jgi:hypothetical protein
VSAAQRANPNVARRWIFGAIRIPSLFDPLFALPERSRMPNSSTLTRARREPQRAGQLYDLRAMARAARQQRTH